MIYWLIGQPGSGKTTLAKEFVANKKTPTIHFDGDALRLIFGNSYDPKHFTKEYRIEQTKILQKLVAYIDNQNATDVVVSTVNPYRDIREEFKLTHKNVIEIYITKMDDRGREKYAVAEFEHPIWNFIHIDTTGKSITLSVSELLLKINCYE